MALLTRGASRPARRWALLAAGALAAPAAAAAQGRVAPSEYEVKAAYLFNFMQYVDWPAAGAPGTEVVLCVAGRDPFDGILERTVRGRLSRGRTVRVTRVVVAAQIEPCHVLFVGERNATTVDAWLLAARERPVLTVGEGTGFTAAGGMIGFVVDETVRFAVNLREARRAGLEISSRVLRLASGLEE